MKKQNPWIWRAWVSGNTIQNPCPQFCNILICNKQGRILYIEIWTKCACTKSTSCYLEYKIKFFEERLKEWKREFQTEQSLKNLTSYVYWETFCNYRVCYLFFIKLLLFYNNIFQTLAHGQHISVRHVQFSSVQSLSRVRLFATPWIAAHQASLSITNSRSSLKLMSMESVMPSSHLILCRPLLLLPPIPPNIRVFSNESTLRMKWPKYWSFSFSIIPSKGIPGLISFRMD